MGRRKLTMLVLVLWATLLTASLGATVSDEGWLQVLGWVGLVVAAFLWGMYAWTVRDHNRPAPSGEAAHSRRH